MVFTLHITLVFSYGLHFELSLSFSLMTFYLASIRISLYHLNIRSSLPFAFDHFFPGTSTYSQIAEACRLLYNIYTTYSIRAVLPG